MPKKPAWIMSESDAFDLLDAIDERLATARLGQQQHDVLVRLQSLLEDDLGARGQRPSPADELGRVLRQTVKRGRPH